MTVAFDSNLPVALVLDAERAPAIEECLRAWEGAGEAMHAPSLFRFEVVPKGEADFLADRLQRQVAFAELARDREGGVLRVVG